MPEDLEQPALQRAKPARVVRAFLLRRHRDSLRSSNWPRHRHSNTLFLHLLPSQHLPAMSLPSHVDRRKLSAASLQLLHPVSWICCCGFQRPNVLKSKMQSAPQACFCPSRPFPSCILLKWLNLEDCNAALCCACAVGAKLSRCQSYG